MSSASPPPSAASSSPQDDTTPGGNQLAVLSYNYWTRHFASDPSVLNKSILVNNVPMTIVGVARTGFTGVQIGLTPDVFVPMSMAKQMTFDDGAVVEWNDHWIKVLGRRKPGVNDDQARAGLNTAYHPLLQENLTKNHRLQRAKAPSLPRQTNRARTRRAPAANIVQRDSGPQLYILFAMVALVLLIRLHQRRKLAFSRAAPLASVNSPFAARWARRSAASCVNSSSTACFARSLAAPSASLSVRG